MIAPFTPLKFYAFENLMENGANAPFFGNIFKRIQNFI